MAPLRTPANAGVKVTLTVQLCPAATLIPAPHVPPGTMAKSLPVTPSVVAINEAGVELAGKVRVTGFTALAVPMLMAPKSAGAAPEGVAAAPTETIPIAFAET